MIRVTAGRAISGSLFSQSIETAGALRSGTSAIEPVIVSALIGTAPLPTCLTPSRPGNPVFEHSSNPGNDEACSNPNPEPVGPVGGY